MLSEIFQEGAWQPVETIRFLLSKYGGFHIVGQYMDFICSTFWGLLYTLYPFAASFFGGAIPNILRFLGLGSGASE